MELRQRPRGEIMRILWLPYQDWNFIRQGMCEYRFVQIIKDKHDIQFVTWQKSIPTPLPCSTPFVPQLGARMASPFIGRGAFQIFWVSASTKYRAGGCGSTSNSTRVRCGRLSPGNTPTWCGAGSVTRLSASRLGTYPYRSSSITWITSSNAGPISNASI